jgi:hypothetical protein
MQKMRIVVFTSNNARMLTNPENPEQYRAASNCVVNPNLDKVAGLPPHYWKLSNGEILPMNEVERKARDMHHSANGVDNRVQVVAKHVSKWVKAVLWAGVSAALSLLAYLAVHHAG